MRSWNTDLYRFFVLSAGLGLAAFGTTQLGGCGGDDSKNQQSPIGDGDGTGTGDGDGDGTGDGDGDGTGDGDGDGDGDGTDTEGPLTCDDVICEGHGHCVEDENGAHCECDEYYVLDIDGTTCIVDESCIKLRHLEDECRQRYNDAPAVGLFFGVDFCAGTAVTPEKKEELGVEFLVLENDVDIAENVESSAQIIPTDVESFVTIVLDVSDSIADDEVALAALIPAVQEFVSTLEPDPGAPKVFVELFVFGRNVEQLVPLTENVSNVNAALTSYLDDPEQISNLVGGQGTSLYAATERGIEHVQRNRLLRRGVSAGGVLSTGTVVVITDGQDTSNSSLNTGLINGTLNQVISVGISHDIDDEDLTKIGKDGSFLAPDADDWSEAFAEIADRVKHFPDRAYLLGYCSSATEDSPEVTISLTGIEPEETATCKFDADYFATAPPVECNSATFTDECDNAQCGGMTGCGYCPDDQCCNGWGTCSAPESAPDCIGDDALCAPTNQICQPGENNDDPHTCVDPPGIGQPCTADGKCDPGTSVCDVDAEPPVCIATFGLGAECEDYGDCSTLHCDQHNPDNPLDPEICLPPAEMYTACSGGKAVCETGTFCSGDCTFEKWVGAPCSNGSQCLSGICNEDFGICVGANQCYWAWQDKITN